MSRKIRMIWDFRGPNAKQTAAHHLVHLKEYLKVEEVWFADTGIEEVSNMHSFAYVIVGENDMQKVRKDLKPHRGRLFEE
ncbi:hypothetical protein ACFQ1M_03215 [Sungkyunkwania multivorans]|uniref:Uncharacterized protein n=1 Tax=Sungkyunkwania multivorans TaxID=1173618 RepID=A0ABW3CUM2_9FLAO